MIVATRLCHPVSKAVIPARGGTCFGLLRIRCVQRSRFGVLTTGSLDCIDPFVNERINFARA